MNEVEPITFVYDGGYVGFIDVFLRKRGRVSQHSNLSLETIPAEAIPEIAGRDVLVANNRGKLRAALIYSESTIVLGLCRFYATLGDYELSSVPQRMREKISKTLKQRRYREPINFL